MNSLELILNLVDKKKTIEKWALLPNITLMCSLSEKLLTVILALLLGLSPLQGAVAAMQDSPAQDMGMHQMVEQPDEQNTVTLHQMSHDCQQHKGDRGCTSHASSCNQCASCVVGLLPVTTSNVTPTVTTGLRPFNDGLSTPHAPSLYRPPRG